MDDTISLDEQASWLLSELPKASDVRARLLCELEILRKLTDENHGLTAKEIAEILSYRSEDGKKPSEPTILDDLHALENCPVGALSASNPGIGKNDGFKNSSSFLTPAQVRLLMNMAGASRFIGRNDSRELISGLNDMLSYYEEDDIYDQVHVDRRVPQQSLDVFGACDVIAHAIKTGRKIEFEYINRDFKGQEHSVLPHVKTFVETPINLVYSFGHYYVETWYDGHSRPLVRRLDRIRNPKVSAEKAAENEQIEECRATIDERLPQSFDMFPGKPAELFLKVNKVRINEMYNRFGSDCVFENCTKSHETGEVEEGYLRVTVQLSPTFYRWLFGFGDMVKIVKPYSSLWAVAGSWANLPTANRPFEDLVSDYETAVEGYKRQLAKIIAAYE